MGLNRRQIGTGMAGMLAVSAMRDSVLAQSTAGTPDASPTATLQATPQASPVVVRNTTTAGVLDEYLTQAGRLRESGRAVVEAVLAGNDAALLERASPDVEAALAAQPVGEIVAGLETNRVSFALADLGAWFDGGFDGTGVMSGFFYQGGPASFVLEAVDAQSGGVPTGHWIGEIVEYGLGIEVTFTGGADDLAVAVSVPEQDLADLEADAVTFSPSRAIGERIGEQVMPFTPVAQAYASEHAWSDWLFRIAAVFDAEGMLIALTFKGVIPLPDDPAGDIAALDLQFPSTGAWWVFWGGDSELRNYHAVTPGQRHALDLVVWRDGATFRGDGSRPEDYHCWGLPVLAPVAGTVVAVETAMPDMEPGATLAQLAPEEAEGIHPAGNHVIIETAGGTFMLLAHMMEGSVLVAMGDQLVPGDAIGVVGNSGNTSEPHIHIHAQSVADFFNLDAIGLPIAFTDLHVNGEQVGTAAPIQGDIVEP